MAINQSFASMPYTLKFLDSAKSIDKQKLVQIRTFHEEFNDISFFQHINLYDFINGLKGYNAKLLIVYKAGRICTTLMILEINHGPTWFSYLNKRILVTGHPVISPETDSSSVRSFLIGELIDFAKKNSVFIEFRPHVQDNILSESLMNKKFVKSDHLNLRIELSNFQELWKSLHESKKRQIKRSRKNGLIVEACSGENELKAFHTIVSNLYTKRIKKPYPDYAFFQRFYNELQLKGRGVVLISKVKNEVLGGMLCPFNQQHTIYEWYIAGLDRENVKNGVHPSVMLTWSAIKYGFENGFKVFDFMGAGKPTIPYGVRDFKKRFGGDLVNAGRYIHVNKPVLYRLLGIYFKIRNSFK